MEAPLAMSLSEAAPPTGAPRQMRNEMTQAGMPPNDLAYMSPEQVRGESFDFRSDVFQLGIMLFMMLTGRRLYSAVSEFQVMTSINE